MNIETARAQAEPLYPGDWERYERQIAYTDAEAIAPESLDAATVGGWAWWAELLVDAVLAAPPRDKGPEGARQLQAICCALGVFDRWWAAQRVSQCPDCEEPNKCQVMGCGAAAMLRAGLLPKRFEGSVLGKVCDRLGALGNAVLRTIK